jgi:hypothetical protein
MPSAVNIFVVRPRVKPLAIILYERYRMGRPVETLARELEIPAARVEQRIRAAKSYVATHRRMPEWI